MQYPHMLCSYASIVPYAASRECHHINFVAQLQSYRRITLNLELKPARCISKSEQLAPVPPREVEVMFLLLSTSSAHSAPGGGNRSVWQLQRRLLCGIRRVLDSSRVFIRAPFARESSFSSIVCRYQIKRVHLPWGSVNIMCMVLG